MSSPRRYVIRALLFIAVALCVIGLLANVIWQAFLHNPYLNSLILAVLLLGIAYNFRRIFQLYPANRWIEVLRGHRPGISMQAPPPMLASLATVMGERDRRGRTKLSPVSVRHLLDSIGTRLDESRDIARYQTGLLIFLGLLGTFWGLLQAIGAVSGVINGLSISSTDVVSLFNDMKSGLMRPLSGMGTAFSASLFGLSGSLILGFLDLQATQAQNGFANDLEEWLSGMARFGGDGGEFGNQPIPVYVQAMLEQTAENLDRLNTMIARGEDGRGELNHVLHGLNDRLSMLGDSLRREQDLMGRMSDGFHALAEQLARRGDGALDPASRDHLRSTDAQLGRLITEIVRERDELKNEIKILTRTVAIAAGEPVPPGRG